MIFVGYYVKLSVSYGLSMSFCMDDDPKSQFVIPGVRRRERERQRKSSFLLVSRVTAGKKEKERERGKKEILGPPKRKQYSYTYAYTYPLSLCLVPLYCILTYLLFGYVSMEPKSDAASSLTYHLYLLIFGLHGIMKTWVKGAHFSGIF